MHSIYIDVLIFTNIFQDFIVLLILKKILHLKSSYLRLLAGSLTGGITSLIALIPPLNFLLNIITKIAVALLLVLVTFGFQNRKNFVKNTVTLFIISFLFNGALICFYLAIKPNGMEIINDTVYFNISPLLLIILTLIIYFILSIYKRLFKNHTKHYETVTVTIHSENKEYIVKCKIDSGCNVKEPFSGSYVIIVEESKLPEINPDKSKIRVIPFESLGGNGIIYGFKADEIKINNKKQSQEIYIGLSTNVFKNGIDGIIPQKLIED